jgi:biotin synthase-like enzyme
MTHRTSCQFCGQFFEVEIEQDAQALFRIEKLLAMAACNKCANKRRTASVHRERQQRAAGLPYKDS